VREGYLLRGVSHLTQVERPSLALDTNNQIFTKPANLNQRVGLAKLFERKRRKFGYAKYLRLIGQSPHFPSDQASYIKTLDVFDFTEWRGLKNTSAVERAFHVRIVPI